MTEQEEKELTARALELYPCPKSEDYSSIKDYHNDYDIQAALRLGYIEGYKDAMDEFAKKLK